jgi:DNA invertase Pin-like site-specific DNA recombinase
MIPASKLSPLIPHATRLTLHILAAVAEHEREMIAARTKAA